MAWQTMAQFKFNEPKGFFPTVILRDFRPGDVPQRAKTQVCKVGEELCAFKSKSEIALAQETMALSFDAVSNERAATRMLLTFAKGDVDAMDLAGRIGEVFVYISKPDYLDFRGEWHNWWNKSDPGLKMRDVQIKKAELSGGTCFTTLLFASGFVKRRNL
jgi:hypothetical protein